MAIYEYTCNVCGRDSELLVRGNEQPLCSHCGSGEVEKRLSVFAIGKGPSAAAGCGCSDKRREECGCEPVAASGGCGCGGRCGGH